MRIKTFLKSFLALALCSLMLLLEAIPAYASESIEVYPSDPNEQTIYVSGKNLIIKFSLTLLSEDAEGTVNADYTDFTLDAATNSAFTSSLKTFTSADFTLKETKTDETHSSFLLTLPLSKLGEGGSLYFRVNAVNDEGTTMASSAFLDSFTVVKIDSTNFGGLATLLAKGKDLYKKTYDTDKNGWLDQTELTNITSICNLVSKKVSGGYTLTGKMQYAVSSIRGMEYLTSVTDITIYKYSKSVADLSKCKSACGILNIKFYDPTVKSLTINAPYAKHIDVNGGSSKTFTSLNLSACTRAVYIYAYNGAKSLSVTLPKKNSNLHVIELQGTANKTVDLTKYSNLNQIYFYNCKVTSVKTTGLKKLHYFYLYHCNKIKSLNLKKVTSLKGVDIFKCKYLKAKKVKKYSKTKVTQDKGKWWYGTKYYTKEMKAIAKLKGYQ